MELRELCGVVIGFSGLSLFGLGAVGLIRQVWNTRGFNYALLAFSGNALCAAALQLLP